MRQVHFLTANGRTADLIIDDICADARAWGGFDTIHDKAMELLKADETDAWVIISEGAYPQKYECKVFRGYYVSRGYLKA
jgi:predicted RNA-binding protein with PIN domain